MDQREALARALAGNWTFGDVLNALHNGASPGSSGNDVFPQTVSDADVSLAQKSNAMYGTGFENYGNVDPQTFRGENYTASFLTALKSPTMMLGFDPGVHTIQNDPIGADAHGVIEGQYTPDTDSILTTGSVGRYDFNPTLLGHEFTHRGLQMLRNAYPDNQDVAFINDDPERNEAFARYVHHQATGTEPTDWEVDQWPSLGNQHFPDFVADVEKLAAQHRAKLRPMGPR